MKNIFIYGFFILLVFGCQVNNKTSQKDSNVIFEIEKINEIIEDSLGFNLIDYTNKIGFISKLEIDSILSKIEEGKTYSDFVNKIYSTGFQNIGLIEDSSFSRLKISRIVLNAIFNSVKEIGKNDSPKMKSIKMKLNKLTYKNYLTIGGFESSSFEADIVYIFEEVGLSDVEIVNLFILEYFLIEVNTCTWCNGELQ